jgi:hypothetical protein
VHALGCMNSAVPLSQVLESLATWLASEYVVLLYVQVINGLSLNV